MHEREKWKWSCSVVSDSSDPRDCSLPGSSIHGIFQARVLEWHAIAFSMWPTGRALFAKGSCVSLEVGRKTWFSYPPIHSPPPKKPKHDISFPVPVYYDTQLESSTSDYGLQHPKYTCKIKFGNVCFGERGEAEVFNLTVNVNYFVHYRDAVFHCFKDAMSQRFIWGSVQFSSVTQSCLTLCDPMNHSTPGFPVHHHLPEFTQTHVHRLGDAIQPSHPLSSPFPPAPNPSQHQSLFPVSQLFAWGSQSTGVSALASFLPKNTQGWSPWGWTGWISLQSKGLSRVFNTTVQKHQFFSAQLSSQSNSHIHTWLLEKP